jgi:hypothetical protein
MEGQRHREQQRSGQKAKRTGVDRVPGGSVCLCPEYTSDSLASCGHRRRYRANTSIGLDLTDVACLAEDSG